MHFIEVAQTFKAIEEQSSRTAITILLAELFNHATPHEAEVISYLSLGLLRAPYQGNMFNFAEKSMAKVVAQILDITETMLKERVKNIGDLGSVVANQSWAFTENPTLLEMYAYLITFEKMSGQGSQEEKELFLVRLLKQIDSVAACYVIRVILGKLRLGFSDMTVIDALSWSLKGDKSLSDRIEHAYNISADMGLIARTLKDGGIQAIDAMNITVGVPIRPAAAERLPTAAAILEKIGPCIVQPKLDGFRLQVHIDKRTSHNKIHFFSRNLLDMSGMFPDLLEAIKNMPVETLIIEGEAIGFDEETDSYLPFQETVKRRRKYDIEAMVEQTPLKLVVFDLLYLNGLSYMGHVQKSRQAKLQTLLDTYNNNLIVTTNEALVTTAQQLEHYFMSTITAGLEGVVVKKPDAIYQPGKRNFNWIKLKRQEEGHLDDTLDLVVLGYYYGKGKRAAFGIGAFLVGVYNPQEDRFETVAKIGTGLSDQEWKDLKNNCDQLSRREQPHNVVCAKELYPHVWVEPSIVVMVRADEITKSPLHAAGKDEQHSGLALRFPRFMEYRIDKKAPEATTVDELRTLFLHQR